MSGKRVLLVFSNAPAPFGNAASRWYYVLLRGLRDSAHRVTAFAASEDPEQTEEARRLFPAPDFDLRCYPFPCRTGTAAKWETFWRPHSYNFSPQLRRDLETEMARGFDVLHCEQLWSGWLGVDAPKRTVVNVHYSFGVDCAHIEPGTLRERLMMMRTTQSERYLLRRFRTVCALTEPLVERIRHINPKARVELMPLGIESRLYEYREPTRDPSGAVVGMIGSFNWQPTYIAARRLLCDLWPRIRSRFPSARLMLAGRHARSAMQNLPAGPGVEFHENVADIAPYFHALDIFLYAPPHGSGMKVKILEALGFGSPIVTTPAGSEGIPLADGVHASVADTDEELAQRAIALLENPAQARQQTRAGRQLLESYCDPQRSVQRFADLYESL